MDTTHTPAVDNLYISRSKDTAYLVTEINGPRVYVEVSISNPNDASWQVSNTRGRFFAKHVADMVTAGKWQQVAYNPFAPNGVTRALNAVK